MGLKKKLQQVFETATLRHFSITTFGTAVNGFLGLLFYIVTARSLGPEVFGILAIAIALITLVSDIADFGIDTTILRFIGKYRHVDKKKSFQFLKLGFEIKAVVWLIILFLGWFIAPKAAEIIFLKPELTFALRFALVGIGGALIFSLMTHAIQAFEKFWLWNLLNISMNGLRFLAILCLIFLGSLNLDSTLVVYISVLFLGFFASLFFLPNFLKVQNEESVSSELLKYSKWVAVVGILAAMTSRLDTFISVRFLSVAQVGIYSAAVQLTSAIPQLVFALATVVAPKLAGFDSDEQAITYLKKLQLLVGGLFIAGILLIPLSFIVVPLIFGQAYQASIVPLMILLLAQLVFLLALPSHQAIYYYFAKPSIMSNLAVIQLIIVAIGGWILISNLGIVGAGFTALLNNLVGFIVPFVWVVYQFKKGGKYEEKEYLGAHAS